MSLVSVVAIATVAVEVPGRTSGDIARRIIGAVVSSFQSVEHHLIVKRDAVELVRRRFFAGLLHHEYVARINFGRTHHASVEINNAAKTYSSNLHAFIDAVLAVLVLVTVEKPLDAETLCKTIDRINPFL